VNEGNLQDQTRLAALDLARDWIGTPYQHGQSRFRYGSDCLGLVLGVWAELYDRPFSGHIPTYRPNWRDLDPDLDIVALMTKALIPLAHPKQALAGDVVVFRLKDTSPPKHMAILSNPHNEWGPEGRLIHAYWGQAILESSLHPFWAHRACAAFRFPALEALR